MYYECKTRPSYSNTATVVMFASTNLMLYFRIVILNGCVRKNSSIVFPVPFKDC